MVPPAAGLVLAEDVASDLDMPPFDKAMMDGYAVRTADFGDGHAKLAVVEEITAGRTPTKTVGDGPGRPHHDRRADAGRGRRSGHDRTLRPGQRR